MILAVDSNQMPTQVVSDRDPFVKLVFREVQGLEIEKDYLARNELSCRLTRSAPDGRD